MNATRRQFVKTLFAAGQATMVGRFLGADVLAESPTNGPALNFLVFGDWGVNGDVGQRQVAAQMAKSAAEIKPTFMMAVGDNFYQTGVTSVDDPQWKTSFENIYNAPSLQIPCYAIFGNHDYCGNCDAQIEYGKSHPLWIMPSRYYTKSHRIDDKTTVDFFFIDTCPFVNEYKVVAPLPPDPTEAQKNTFEVFTSLRANVMTQDEESQLAWLKEALAKSTAQWKIVVGHHPIYSGGVHGDQPELIEKILPLLHQFGVHVYIAGHDHDLQHLQSEGIDFLCSGAGGAKLYPLKQTEQMVFSKQVFGFMTASLSATAMKVNLIDDTGTIIYPTTIHRSV
jgi:tartrate-resistant acid phosphatase type 5